MKPFQGALILQIPPNKDRNETLKHRLDCMFKSRLEVARFTTRIFITEKQLRRVAPKSSPNASVSEQITSARSAEVESECEHFTRLYQFFRHDRIRHAMIFLAVSFYPVKKCLKIARGCFFLPLFANPRIVLNFIPDLYPVVL